MDSGGPDQISPPTDRGRVIVFVLSLFVMVAGFNWNVWRVAEDSWFETFQRGTESHVVGRMVKSRQDGLLSVSGLLGIVGQAGEAGTESPPPVQFQEDQALWPKDSLAMFQYRAYRSHLPFDTYIAYLSQNGGQGLAFSLLDRLIPLSQERSLELYHFLMSLLAALAVSLVILWFGVELGLFEAGLVLATAALSQWLIVFGSNLWWNLWAFYLPMIVVAFFLRARGAPSERWFPLVGLVFFSFLLKCLANGYEFITTAGIMTLVPVVYYAVKEQWNPRQIGVTSLATVFGIGLAVFASASLLMGQIDAAKGSVGEGFSHLVFSLEARTHGNPQAFPDSYAPSLEAGTLQVLTTYLKGVYLDLNNYFDTGSETVRRFVFSVRFLYLIGAFFFGSGLWVAAARRLPSDRPRRTESALLWATWFSLLAPLSWLILFKAHSQEHPHMNAIVWHMPFTFFGFGLLGRISKRLWQEFHPFR